jgi:hypothetical protein
MNTCNVSTDCAKGSTCSKGLCVAKNADAPLTIALAVTPQRMRDGSDPLPVILDRFTVEGPMTRSFELPSAVTVHGTIRNEGAPIEAQLSFTPLATIPSVAPKAVTAMVTAGAPDRKFDYSVQLLSTVRYRMLVRATDPSLLPVHGDFTAGSTVEQSVEFTAIDKQEQTFTISGAPSDRMLLVGAFDRQTGEPISSTAMLAQDGTATISLAPDAPPFRIEIRAAQSFGGDSVSSPGPCDSNTAAFPVFSVDQKDLVVATDGLTHIDLPPQPQRIRYEGTVDLCTEYKGTVAAIGKLPITLHAHSLLLPQPSTLTASFDATTDAQLDATTGKLRFCVQVMPGEYDVLVTPPSSVPCALFAERSLVQAPDGTAASGALLALPSPTYLGGILRTSEHAPVKGAAVEAVALGRSGGIDLPSDDHSVTGYNRSQQATTGDDGSFKLAVDLGSYDVVIKPPADSGFPWQVSHDVDIGATRGVKFSTVIDMLAPVALSGTLTYARGGGSGTQAGLEATQIDAYAVIADAANSERAVPIGQASADKTGHFTLLLPPSTHMDW